MTDKEFKKLKRSELLELMSYMRQEIDALRIENQKLNSRIDLLLLEKIEPIKPEPETAPEIIVKRVPRVRKRRRFKNIFERILYVFRSIDRALR